MAGAFTYEIDLGGFESFRALWNQAPAVVEEEYTAAVIEAQMLIEREAKERTPEGVGGAGGLRGSITSLPPEISRENILGVVGSSLVYAEPVELGSRPHFPPVDALTDWVILKLGVPDDEAKGVAYAVARKIAQRGMPARLMFHNAMTANQAEVADIFRRANERVVQRLTPANGGA